MQAREILHSLVLPEFGNMKKGMTMNECMNVAVKNFLKNCNHTFDEINREYPAFMKPFRVAELDRNGFRWIHNAPIGEKPNARKT